MRKAMSFFASTLFLIALTTSAFAETNAKGFYLTAKAGFGLAQVDDLDFDLGNLSYTVEAEDDSDTVPLFGFAVGWDFHQSSSVPVRLEVEFMHMGDAEFAWRDDLVLNGVSYDERFNGEINVNSFFLNGYYDFHNASRLTPFIQAGLGFAVVKLDATWNDDGIDMGSESETNTNFAANIGGGVGFALTEHASLDASYRFAYLGPAGIDADAIDVQIETTLWRHDFLLGFRYTF